MAETRREIYTISLLKQVLMDKSGATENRWE